MRSEERAPHEAHKEHAPRHVSVAVITVSDTRSHETDLSGSLLRERLSKAGHHVGLVRLVHDEADEIDRAMVEALEDPGVQALVLTGGTGIAPRDVTIETIRRRFEKELPGFGELFRSFSFAEIGSAAMTSRAIAGIAAGKPVFALPGSPSAVALAMDRLILPELGHLVRLAR